MEVLDEFVKNQACFRAFVRNRQDGNSFHPCWAHVQNALARDTVNTWCMAFGAWGSNQTHWTNVLQSQRNDSLPQRQKRRAAELARKSFREHVSQRLEMSAEEYDAFGASMRDFRNSHTAHRSVAQHHPLPDLSIAVGIVLEFDEWLRVWMFPQRFDYPLLRDSAAAYARSASTEVAAAMRAARSGDVIRPAHPE
ncbi:MAG: hypothetical protein MEQ07_12350 [Aquimonas sp.]|nr:hypothetical protein [Aquimonas sp.]